MTSSDIITIIGIVVNAIIGVISWVVALRVAKKTIQATLAADAPVAKPRKNRRKLTKEERRFLRIYRFVQLYLVVNVIRLLSELWFEYKPLTALGWTAFILGLICVAGNIAVIASVEINMIKQIKNGKFIKQLRLERREERLKSRLPH